VAAVPPLPPCVADEEKTVTIGGVNFADHGTRDVSSLTV